MSVRRAMKQATREFLTSTGGWNLYDCAITRRGGKPHPACGEWFLSIWGGQRTSGIKTAQDYKLSINLTLTRRFSGPMDREDLALDKEEEGVDEKMDVLLSFLYSNQNEIRYRADELMPAGYGGFVTAPYPIQDMEPEEVGPQWFGGTAGHITRGIHRGEFAGGDSQVYGFKANLVFGNWTFIHPVSTGQL